MKQIRNLPQDTGFFATYAKLSASIRRSGFAAQVVSALTEVGGIYAAAYSALMPLFPGQAMFLAGFVAAIGTAVIEIGLRVLTPHTVDAILYRRFGGLHLPMTIAIWLLTGALLATSGILSFQNSKVIVEEFTPTADQQTTGALDSIHFRQINSEAATWSADSAMIAERYQSQQKAQRSAFNGQIEAQRQKLSGYINREKRSGNSFATAKDRIRQKISELEAESAAALAQLESSKASELAEARSTYKTQVGALKARHHTAVDSILAINKAAIDQRETTVGQYGGRLGYFTIICLFVFCASVILDRIHQKGSGIEETVELSQYDVNAPAWKEALDALRDRWQYFLRSRINAFAEKTPPAPLPARPAELYDPTQITNVTITLKLDQTGREQEDGVIYIQPKRRQIGFTSGNTQTNTNNSSDTQKKKKTPNTKHENSCAVNPTPENLNISDLKQRLKMYKKRLGSHQQKANKAERAGKPIPKRTQKAIENNKQWVEHYNQLLANASKQ